MDAYQRKRGGDYSQGPYNLRQRFSEATLSNFQLVLTVIVISMPDCNLDMRARGEQEEAQEVALAISRVKKDLKQAEETECYRRIQSGVQAEEGG